MKNILKINDPFVKTYQHHGFQTGILLGHIDAMGWLYTKYIQVGFRKETSRMDYDHSFFFKEDHVFTRSYYTLSYDFCLNYNIISFIKQFINEGFYVTGHWNEYLISEKKSYQQQKAIHNYLMYGYDEEKEELLSVGYTKDGHWNYFNVSYGQFIDSVLYETETNSEFM